MSLWKSSNTQWKSSALYVDFILVKKLASLFSQNTLLCISSEKYIKCLFWEHHFLWLYAIGLSICNVCSSGTRGGFSSPSDYFCGIGWFLRRFHLLILVSSCFLRKKKITSSLKKIMIRKLFMCKNYHYIVVVIVPNIHLSAKSSSFFLAFHVHWEPLKESPYTSSHVPAIRKRSWYFLPGILIFETVSTAHVYMYSALETAKIGQSFSHFFRVHYCKKIIFVTSYHSLCYQNQREKVKKKTGKGRFHVVCLWLKTFHSFSKSWYVSFILLKKKT